ncbi:MAG: SURF1 family protein, partial [Steroidobacteraceae bacterium]
MAIVRIPVGKRVFAPAWGMTALAAVICALFVHLGLWQWHKGTRREAEWVAFARGADPAVELGSRDVMRFPRYHHVIVTGRFDDAHQFLLDNEISDGRDGYQVLTPLSLADGRALLVDRGWVPFTGSEDRLPDVRLAASAPVSLAGRLDNLPAGGLSFGKRGPPPGDRWPKVTTFPDMPQLSAALGRPLEQRILLLDPGMPFGYV